MHTVIWREKGIPPWRVWVVSTIEDPEGGRFETAVFEGVTSASEGGLDTKFDDTKATEMMESPTEEAALACHFRVVRRLYLGREDEPGMEYS